MCEQTRGHNVRSVVGASGLNLTVGIARPQLNAEATWLPSSDRTLAGLCPFTLNSVFGRPELGYSVSPMALFRGGLYLSPMAGSSSLTWPFALTLQPCELSQSPPTYLHHWFIIFVRLGVNPSALLEWLHLEALDDCVSLRVSLVTIGGCRHLDGLVQRGSSSRGRWLSLAPIVVIVRGSWPFPGGELKCTLMDCSWLLWSPSCVGCVAPDCRLGVWYLLAREPPSGWIATTGTSLQANKWTSMKIIVLSCPKDFLVFIMNDWLHLMIGSLLDTAV
jgi:hypothetical protein